MFISIFHSPVTITKVDQHHGVVTLSTGANFSREPLWEPLDLDLHRLLRAKIIIMIHNILNMYVLYS